MSARILMTASGGADGEVATRISAVATGASTAAVPPRPPAEKSSTMVGLAPAAKGGSPVAPAPAASAIEEATSALSGIRLDTGSRAPRTFGTSTMSASLGPSSGSQKSATGSAPAAGRDTSDVVSMSVGEQAVHAVSVGGGYDELMAIYAGTSSAKAGSDGIIRLQPKSNNTTVHTTSSAAAETTSTAAAETTTPAKATTSAGAGGVGAGSEDSGAAAASAASAATAAAPAAATSATAGGSSSEKPEGMSFWDMAHSGASARAEPPPELGPFRLYEPVRAQMLRLAKIKEEFLQYAASLMEQGQLLVKLAACGKLEPIRSLVEAAREGELLYFYTARMFVAAAENHHIPVLKYMLANGLSRSIPKVATVLHAVVIAAQPNGDALPTIEFLLRHGFDVNAQRRGDFLTPLHLACQRGLLIVSTFLLNRGADVNSVSKADLTPLKCAQLHREETAAAETMVGDEDTGVQATIDAEKLVDLLKARGGKESWREITASSSKSSSTTSSAGMTTSSTSSTERSVAFRAADGTTYVTARGM